MTEDSCYGKQKVEWNKFTNAITCVGIFICVLSCFMWMISIIRNSSYVLFYFTAYFVIFGMVLVIEGTIASFFKIGD